MKGRCQTGSATEKNAYVGVLLGVDRAGRRLGKEVGRWRVISWKHETALLRGS